MPRAHSMSDNASTSNTTWRTSNGTTTVVNAMAMASGIVPGNESTSSMQKRGAERLFQYMEADGSDPEDYSR